MSRGGNITAACLWTGLVSLEQRRQRQKKLVHDVLKVYGAQNTESVETESCSEFELDENATKSCNGCLICNESRDLMVLDIPTPLSSLEQRLQTLNLGGEVEGASFSELQVIEEGPKGGSRSSSGFFEISDGGCLGSLSTSSNSVFSDQIPHSPSGDVLASWNEGTPRISERHHHPVVFGAQEGIVGKKCQDTGMPKNSWERSGRKSHLAVKNFSAGGDVVGKGGESSRGQWRKSRTHNGHVGCIMGARVGRQASDQRRCWTDTVGKEAHKISCSHEGRQDLDRQNDAKGNDKRSELLTLDAVSCRLDAYIDSLLQRQASIKSKRAAGETCADGDSNEMTEARMKPVEKQFSNRNRCKTRNVEMTDQANDNIGIGNRERMIEEGLGTPKAEPAKRCRFRDEVEIIGGGRSSRKRIIDMRSTSLPSKAHISAGGNDNVPSDIPGVRKHGARKRRARLRWQWGSRGFHRGKRIRIRRGAANALPGVVFEMTQTEEESDSEYSAECEPQHQIWSLTGPHDVGGVQRGSESTRDQTSSGNQESPGLPTEQSSRQNSANPNWCRVKASRTLKRKILRGHSGTMKLMVTI
uniref:Uncharacterized protein n=1 Tax=Eptatretus burgeri TaxID=7764 RepID=A0A8C4QZ38_EPTBU